MNFWEFISIFGDVQFWVGAALTSLLFLFAVPKKTRKNIVWFVFLVLPAVIISYSITFGLKNFLKTPRPCFGVDACPISYSFPSGHATVIFAAMTTLSLHYKNRKLTVLSMFFGLLVSVSRVMLGVHEPLDVIAGSIIGIVSGFLVYRAYENYQKEIKGIISEIK
jgi:undecaprenyl-diphosphatase